MAAIAYHRLNGLDLDDAESKVLNDMWLNIRESEYAADYVTWPEPTSMQY